MKILDTEERQRLGVGVGREDIGKREETMDGKIRYKSSLLTH